MVFYLLKLTLIFSLVISEMATNQENNNKDIEKIQQSLESLQTNDNNINDNINKAKSELNTYESKLNDITTTNEEEKKEPQCEDITNLKCRKIAKKFAAHSQKEGAGFTVHRPIGGWYMNETESDPFLMLDELGPVTYAKDEFPGAPWHPHRGFDTVMYIKHGESQHQDSMGTSGVLKAGEVQWMTAGSGIIQLN